MLKYSMDLNDKEAIIEEQKFITVLHELCKENFSVSDDTILDKLYVHCENNATVKNLLDSKLPEIGEWLDAVVNAWNENELFYGVKIFAIRFFGFVGSSHKGFNILKARNVLVHIQKLATRPEMQNDSCIMVPIINVLGLFLNHQDGWDWVTETMVWKCAVKSIYEDRSIYTKRAGVQFTSLLLSTSQKYNSDVGREILSVICEPLLLSHLITVEKLNDCGRKPDENVGTFNSYTTKNTYFGEQIKVSAHLIKASKYLCEVLEHLLSTNAFIPGKLSLVFRPVENIFESVITSDILNSCSSVQNHQTFSLLLLMIDVSNAFRQNCNRSGSETCPLDPVYLHIYWVIRSMTSLGHCYIVSSFCVHCLSWRAKFKQNEYCCNSSCNSCSNFESSMVNCLRILLHLPDLFSTQKTCLCKKYILENNIKIENSCIGASLYTKIMSECMSDFVERQRLAFQYMQSGVFAITRSLNYIKDSTNTMNIFTDVLDALESMVKLFHSHQDMAQPVLLHLLNLASNLIETYHLPYWKINEANDENLLVFVIKFLGSNCSDERVTVTSLQVLIRILRFHVMPDLLCKVELVKHIDVRVQVSKLSMLVFKLASPSWEVRDTTLEVFQTMIELAELTPWFFLDLFQNNLVNKIFETASNDESAYVRASALNFFSRTVRSKLFENTLSPSVLCALSIKTLLQDNMPVARRAACELITALYITYVPTVLIDPDKLFEAVFTATMKDFDWEVKKAALLFWRCTIDKHMMDKMVPLDSSASYFYKDPKAKEETSLKIKTILDNLGEIGCLKAVWIGVNDDCDLKVSQEAHDIVNHLEELDKQWNFINTLGCDDIGEQNDTELLVQKLRPKEFFTLLKNHQWREQLESRKNWIENSCDDLTSLLDHILNADSKMGDWDHNAVDCY